VRVAHHVRPHQTLDAEPGVAELPILVAVAAGGKGGAVGRPAVGLDDELVRRPEEVDLEPGAGQDLHVRVRHGLRHAGVGAEREEPALELLAREGCAEQLVAEDAAQRADAARAVDAGQHRGDGRDVEHLEPIGLLDRPLERRRPHDAGEVDERPGDRRARDAISQDAVLGPEDLRPVEPDARPCSLAGPRNHHVHAGRRPRDEPEVASGGAMRQRRAVAGGEDRSLEGGSRDRRGVTDRVDPFVPRSQPPDQQPSVHLARRRPEPQQLRVGDDATLGGREVADASKDD
jgi:hypothetical protein